MVKEFILICAIALVAWFALKKIIGTNSDRVRKIAIGIIILGIMINIAYDMYRLFPETWLNTVGGDYRYGTFHGNMLAWSDKFMYGEEILIPMVRNRHISLDEDAAFCSKFFSIYGKDIEKVKVLDEDRKAVIAQVVNSKNIHSCEFEALALMGYTWDVNMPSDLIDGFDNHIYPFVYIDMDSIKDKRGLKIVMDDDRSLYIVGC